MRISTLFLATVLSLPAFASNAAGTWSVSATDPDGRVHKSEMTLNQDGASWKGVIKAGQQTIPMRDVQLQGEELIFKLPWDNFLLTIKLRISGDEMKGTFTTAEGDGGPISAKRAGASAAAGAGGVGGRWKVTAVTGGGREMKLEIELKEDAGKWAGTITTADGMSLALTEVAVSGQDVSFKIPTEQGAFAIKLSAAGAGLKGTYTTPDGQTGSLTAIR